MIIKSADDKGKRIALLEDLQNSTLLDERQKDWLSKELHSLRTGIAGERDAAHYIDAYMRDSKNMAVLHDLRLSVDGVVAQIDHLLINRVFEFYLLETKNFNGNLVINERGEFSVQYRNEREFGIESPIEQSKRHERVLSKLLTQLDITGRAGTAPVFHHLVLVHPKSTIKRPAPKTFDTTNVIKADQLMHWHNAHVDNSNNVFDAIKGLMNLRQGDTVHEWGEKLQRQHRPADLLSLPDFMRPRAVPVVAEPRPAAAPLRSAPTPPPAATPVGDKGRSGGYFCASCKKGISKTVADFCFERKQRFGGKAYCMDHQKAY